MEIIGNNIKQKLSNKFSCEKCHYTTDRKSNIDNHFKSNKHQKEINGNNFKQELSNLFICKDCDKEYQTNAGLWKHKNKNICCKNNIHNESDIEIPLKTEFSEKDELIHYLMNESKELKNLILEVLKNGTNNNISNINSHNKTFNLNVFLNETCKNAMNITEFVNSIQLQLSDLEKVGELGYIEGISNIIIKNLKALDITERPVHCTDKKRETMYIKDEDKWEKEDDSKSKLHKMVRRISNKNIDMISDFKLLHPEWKKSTSKVSDQFNTIVIESMGGAGDNDFEKEEKIIKRVAKQVLIDKIST
jgi:hypothetical protein